MKQKPLVLSDIRSRAGAFVAQWQEAEGYERGEAQSFVRDLLRVFGITKTTAAVYEKRAQRASTGNRGYIDALISGTALIEMKSAGEDLEQAEAQALDYMESLTEHEQPDYIITSDFRAFRLLDLTAEVGETSLLSFRLEELPEHVEDLMFLAGYRRAKFGSVEQENASIKAAQLMARLYEHLESTGYDEHQASIFLIRTLFCLYADDSGLWERDLFSRYLEERTSEDGSDLGAQLSTLYQALNKPEDKRYGQDDDLMQAFPYVNGSVFGEAVEIPYFDRSSRGLLIQAAYFNWSSISPAIFGSLFQAVKDKKSRRLLGEHYTTETNILKLIRPLFLDELEERFTKAYARKNDLEKLLDHLSTLTFLDPACGCGNFLIIAYRELRALELRIHERLQQLDPSRNQLVLDAAAQVHVRLTQFHGLEIEEWPATIARTAMFLVEHQANQDMTLALGNSVPMLPLQDSAHIVVTNALQADWQQIVPESQVLYVMGNPPFLGDNTREVEQAEDLRQAWGGDKVLSRMDYVTGWHAKTLQLFSSYRYAGQWGFVTTNSITQGDQVPRLFRPIFDNGWRIKFAHQTFAWSSESPGAASVHCVIVTFTRESKTQQRLFEYERPKAEAGEFPVSIGINAYLQDAKNIFVEKRSAPLSPALAKTEYGSKPTDDGNFIIEPEDYAVVTADPVAAKYVHKYVGARELLRNEDRWCFWLDGMDPDDLSRSRILRERVEAVRVFRSKSKAASTREYPHHHLFRQLAKQDEAFVCVPRHVSETRRFFTVARFDEDVIASDANFTIRDPDGFQFAIMSSSMFITWQKAIGGRLKSDLRFGSTLTWYTLPLPQVGPDERAAIAEAGQGILEARELHSGRSLAQHYSPLAMDPALVAAHETLDRLVDRAFGAAQTLRSNDDRATLLFQRYAELTT